ncbi:unnamed protein product [Phytophthora lilii]|uniref:Unnamed protein product n=1 Tax=Phytophthora lilii TaxID=2077276 RepID=A0A9W6WWG1_9STRA|nr:unnamed protein product [Phytophthora lilii]
MINDESSMQDLGCLLESKIILSFPPNYDSSPQAKRLQVGFATVITNLFSACQANLLNEAESAALMNERYDTSFNEEYDALQRIAAPSSSSRLRQFCCGLATVFAKRASVESDFSTLKWELDDRRSALTSLVLEGIF